MQSLLKNIRFYVLTASFLLSVIIYILVKLVIFNNLSQTARMEQFYAFASIICLYFTLLAGPFCYTFRSFPYRKQYVKARRALGVATFYFAFLHTVTSFFGQLDGFAGIGFLDYSYLIAVLLGFVALFIFSLL